MKINTKITITRSSSDEIKLRVRDEASRLEFLEIRLTPHDFAMALTGLSEVKCESAAVTGLENVGKTKITENRSVLCPLDTHSKEELADWLIQNAQEPGWILSPYLGSQRSVQYEGDRRRLNYVVYKYVGSEVEQQQAATDADFVRQYQMQVAELQRQHGALVEALDGALDSLEYVQRHLPGLAGCGVRAERIAGGRAALAKAQTLETVEDCVKRAFAEGTKGFVGEMAKIGVSVVVQEGEGLRKQQALVAVKADGQEGGASWLI